MNSYPTITFRDFMEDALYHPERGYYTSERVQGAPYKVQDVDFFTSPHVHPAFAKTLARVFAGYFQRLGLSEGAIVEAGAGQGQLAYDILCALSEDYPRIFESITYHVVERSPVRRRQALGRLEPFAPRVRFWEQVGELPEISGLFFSNELLDSFPPHVLLQTEEGLQEVAVQQTPESSREVVLPISDPLLTALAQGMWKDLGLGQRVEVNVEALDWLKTVSQKLKSGYVVTIDYGGITDELRNHWEGTVRAFSRHQVGPVRLNCAGQEDLTSHVNFTALIEEGRKFGLGKDYYGPQGNFLLSSGIQDFMPMGQDLDSWKERSQIKTLFHPDGMGERFKVLVQKKLC